MRIISNWQSLLRNTRPNKVFILYIPHLFVYSWMDAQICVPSMTLKGGGQIANGCWMDAQSYVPHLWTCQRAGDKDSERGDGQMHRHMFPIYDLVEGQGMNIEKG